MEPNIPRAQTKRRMEENFRLQNLEQKASSQTLQDDRHTRYDLNAEEGRLDVYTGYNLSFQPYKSQLTTATISNLSNIRSQLHASWNAIWDLYCAIHIRKNDTTNNNIRGNNEDNNNIRRDGMDNQSKQEQTGTQEINNISRMELERRINDVINNQIDEEIGNGSVNQTSTVDTVAGISNRMKQGKAVWTNLIYIRVQITRGGLHIASMNREMSKRAKRADWNSPIKNAQDLSNINNGCFSEEMEINLINAEIGHTENILTIKNKNPNIEQKRNSSNLIRTELFLANNAIQTFAIPEGENRQNISMPQLNQRKSQSRIEKTSRLDPSIHRIAAMGSQIQTYPRNQQHKCGFAIEARSFGRLFNIQINAIASARRMKDSNYSRLLRNKEKYKTSQILFNRQ
ncbi:MAG: hypothetical protein EZS28_021081 [Streblomastix strix]|uniref:Uncharacterized protein n=1 Tax=Streblomastix strix TaxID=222440 RepID=A0A5J4VLD2_9EUKA|nr:MAG: hypothetical protein EZS28_021081 [Streblomastix strix]